MNDEDLTKLIAKATTLMEAFPYILRYKGASFVIKYGGSAMVEKSLRHSFAQDVAMLKLLGVNPIIVHGGGPQIGKTLDGMGIKTHFVDGHRVTDDETMEVVEKVLVGKINNEIVSLISNAGVKAVGLSGRDDLLIKAEKMSITKKSQGIDRPEIIDIGHVGRVSGINGSALKQVCEKGGIPVIAPVGVGSNGDAYNINADSVAGAIAAELKSEKLLLLTDEKGIYDGDKRLLTTLNGSKVEKLISSTVIVGGMLPKVKSCFTALDAGVNKTHIIDGRVTHSVLLEIFTDEGIGTEITT